MAEKASTLRVVDDLQIAKYGYPRVPLETDAELGLGLREYWNILYQNKWLLILAMVLGALLGALKASSEVPLYRANVAILVEPDFSQLASGTKGTILFPNLYRFYETQYELLRSRVVAAKVVEKLKLADSTEKVLPEKTEDLLTWLKNLIGFDNQDRGKVKVAVQSQDSLIAAIQRGVSVQGGEKSQLVNVSFVSPDPEFAAQAANTLVDVYIDLGLESKESRAKQASGWLSERLQELSEEVRDSENALQAYQRKEGMVDLKRTEALGSTNLATLNSNYLAAQARYAELSKRYGPKHPKIVEAKAELSVAKSRLDSVSKNLVGTKAKEFELAKLEREVESNRQLYNVFLEKFKETDLSSDYKISHTRIIDRARVPATPFAPDQQRIIMLWAGMGFIVGVLLVFMRHHLDNRFRNAKQLEDVLGLPVLGIMPFLGKQKSKRNGSAGHADAVFPERHFIQKIHSGFAESVNHIRTGILYSNVDHPPQVILATSAVQAEGKTTLATNLALSYSQLDRTLLIDADLRKPRIHETTSTSSEHGLVEYVAGLKSLQDCVIQDHESKNLYVLNSGVIPPNPLELLSSEKFKQTIAELRKKFNHIVIDTAPVLPVSDAIVLGHIVDAVILVVQADRTAQKTAVDAFSRLQNSNVTPMGAVLTQVSASRRSSYHYDGRYQYYYGGYYGQKTRKS